MPKSPRFYIELWSEHFLGTREKCVQLLELLETMDGARWIPERWNDCEPVRKPYGSESRELICSKWTAKGFGITNHLMFRKSRPSMQAWAECWRANRPSLNRISLEFEAKAFPSADGVSRFISVFLEFVDWSRAVYGSARHSGQMHLRRAVGTPLDRLTNADWLTFFGQPYLDLFGGKERVLAAPCFRTETVSQGVLLQASPRPDCPEMTDSDAVLKGIEEFLGRDIFIAEDFSDIPCRVPQFDLSETVMPEEPGSKDRCDSRFESSVVIRNRRTKRPTAVIAFTNPESEKS